jgi:hypothetical protein
MGSDSSLIVGHKLHINTKQQIILLHDNRWPIVKAATKVEDS